MSKKSQNFYTIGIYLNNQLSVSIMKANELAFAGKVFPTYMENLKDIFEEKIVEENAQISVCIHNESDIANQYSLIKTIVKTLLPKVQVINSDPIHILHEAFSEISEPSGNNLKAFEKDIMTASKKLDYTNNSELNDYEVANSFLTARYAWNHVKLMEAKNTMALPEDHNLREQKKRLHSK